jgi:bifunctional N-acetylglucosamine-1-phosphate-uridyltransferase/glucosamine-1-phosphate-acetyltransferase GlmU-like protein
MAGELAPAGWGRIVTDSNRHIYKIEEMERGDG